MFVLIGWHMPQWIPIYLTKAILTIEDMCNVSS
jgi:hypothetical protein